MNSLNPQFPIGFAEKLLQYEINYKLTHEPSSDLVNQLMQLYRKGFEYCESVKSYKYLYFQLKINELITTDSKSAVKVEVQSENKKLNESGFMQRHKVRQFPVSKPHNHSLNPKPQKQTTKLLHTKQMITNTRQSVTRIAVKKMISDKKIKQIQNNQKVNKELAMQDEALAKKLEKRSRKISTKQFFGRSDSTVDASMKEERKKYGRRSVDFGVMKESRQKDGGYERILDLQQTNN